jgi:hypothetical protein
MAAQSPVPTGGLVRDSRARSGSDRYRSPRSCAAGPETHPIQLVNQASTGENLGEDAATLVVIVDGGVIYDGLLDEAP